MVKRVSVLAIAALAVLWGGIDHVTAQSLRERILERTGIAAEDTFQETDNAESTLLDLVENGITIFVGALGILAVIFIIYAGFKWMTAGGNATQVEDAKKILKTTIIGLLIVSVAYFIVAYTIRFFVRPPRIRRVSQAIEYHQLAQVSTPDINYYAN